MNEMQELRAEIESFDTASKKFAVESVAIEAIDMYGYSDQVNSMMSRLGLESATALYDGVVKSSNEGIGAWISEKVGALTHRVQILANKVYAKITSADESVKEAIRRAEAAGPGSEIQLPVSKGVALATVGVITAAAVAIGYLTKGLLSSSKKVETSAVSTTPNDPSARITHDRSQDGKSRVRKTAMPGSEHGVRVIKEVNVAESNKLREQSEKLRGEGKHEDADRVLKLAEKSMEDAVAKTRAQTAEGSFRSNAQREADKVDVGFIKGLGDKVSGAFKALKASISGFLAAITKTARDGSGNDKGVMARVRLCGSFIVAAFKHAWTALGSGANRVLAWIGGVFKKKEGEPKPAAEGFGRL